MHQQESLLSPTTYLESEGLVQRWNYPLRLFNRVNRSLGTVGDDVTKSQIAWDIDRYWLQRRSPNSLKTITGLAKYLRLLSRSNQEIAKQGEMINGKQQPSLIEAIEETVVRLKFLSLFVQNLPNSVLSCISGGSMSYGRFFNIRGGENSSDLDLILVFENGNFGNLHADQILSPDLGFAEDEIRLLSERLRVFTQLEKQGQADVLSQKARVVNQGFDVSMHLMNRGVFAESTLFGVVHDAKTGQDVEKRLLDYKPQPFKHRAMRQRDFYGNEHLFEADEASVIGGVTEQEVISRIPAYGISQGKFVPGMYHNLVSPRFEYEPFTSPLVSSVVTMYWSFMRDLEKQYRQKNPTASVLKSHIRYDLFSHNLRQFYE